MRATERVSLATLAREWGRLGVIGVGGPPAHVALLRDLCVRRRDWLSPDQFEDALATVNLLPGPASTQLALYCAWVVRGVAGVLVGAACFVGPGTLLIVALATLFLQSHPPVVVIGAGAAMSAVVPVVAAQSARLLVRPSWTRTVESGGSRGRWAIYVAAGLAGTLLLGPWLVVVILGTGLVELVASSPSSPSTHRGTAVVGLATKMVAVGVVSGLGALALEAFKVGALSYGGGFVIIPLMQHDTVVVHHWMTGWQFSNAVALGQLTPGPVVQTVAVVGYAAAGYVGAGVATLIAFTPSVLFVLLGGPSFERLRRSSRAQRFLTGSGPAAIGAIAGSALLLASPLSHLWQVALSLGAVMWVMVLGRSSVVSLLGAALLGVGAALLGLPLVH